MSESTRIIASTVPHSAQRSNASARHGNDLQFFRADLTPGHEGVAGADPETGKRFVSEIHFANYFARKLADTLAMQRLQLGVIEDRDSQTAFSFSVTDSRWHGFITPHRLSLEEARGALSKR